MKNWAIGMMAMPIFFYYEMNKEAEPAFSAAGYWQGHASPEFIGILNRPNGTSRLYLLSNNTDSAITDKVDGTYTVKGDFFRFESSPRSDSIFIYMETSQASSHSMEGVLVHESLARKNSGTAVSFEVIRQP